ncbi:U-box domain-containing protein 35-like [Spinacia oleracea]|uniref:RING-type E3 ubiquitin transferase n=1 Tax=Spinacia oleracea TaxID=3562 RepID=A0A9R0JCB6_SPIOL|nr:U-box domain-containing protein 35-like [Spinacia oleracea]
MDALPETVELGHNAVAVAIDKSKNSQQAVRWTIDNFLKGKEFQIVLVHVKTHHHNAQVEYSAGGTSPTESDVQHLFLPYRGFCSRKGIDAIEVVLHDIDVSSALINYIEHNNLGNIVVGASNRNAITRRFKAADVPTCLEKSAPDFCAVYVIYKGKVQTLRPSNVCLMPNAPVAALIRSGTSSNSGASTYRTTHSKSSFGNSSISSHTSRSSIALSERNYSSGSSNPSNHWIPSGRESSTHLQRLTPDGGHQYIQPRSIQQNGCDSDSPTIEHRLTSSNRYNNTPRIRHEIDFSGNHYPSTYSRSSDNSSNHSSSRLQVLGHPPPHPYSNTSTEYTSRNSYTSSSEGRSTPERRYNNVRNPSYGSAQDSSFESASATSLDYSEQHPRSSTSSQGSSSFGDELEVEMARLKLEIRSTMQLYHSICDQANVAKQQADLIQNGNDDSIEEVRLAREAVLVVADLERLKCQAAMDAAHLSEKLVDLENRKTKMVEQKAARHEEEDRRSGNNTSTQLATYRLYSLKDIEIGTNYFSSSLKIGEGGYGPVYRAIIQHTSVAIKVLRPNVSQGLKQFQQEIEVLGRMRHPNMVLLLGACPEYGCLVYEYMENGSLEDRLFHKNGTPTIPWKARFKIAAEIATSLLFLHDAKPDPMVHRDLKPANILLDSNYTSKIGDVGLARLVPSTVANQMTQYHMTAAAGTFCYIDPEYQQTGQLGTKSDIYSLGIILLQLITAKHPMALSYHVEEAIEAGKFDEMLDPAVPNWPFQEALDMAKLAIKCTQLRKKDRPDLDSFILPELIRLRDLAMSS